MSVPFGWVALLVGFLGGVVYVAGRVRGGGPEFPLLVGSVAAFVAGWVACVSLPRLERRIEDARRAGAGTGPGGSAGEPDQRPPV